MRQPKIAIIGAGLAGLVLARELREVAEVKVFEKARGVGGRMATRRADAYQFDHGAQFFLAKTQAFQAFLEPLIDIGVIARWDAEFVEITGTAITHQRRWNAELPHYVGTPGMNHLCKHLASDVDVALNARAAKLKYNEHQWQLLDSEGQILGEFDWVVSTAPAEQTAALLPDIFVHMDRLKATKMLGCYNVMLGFTEPLDIPWQAALVLQRDISWVSINSSKPGRKTPYTISAHATNKWAEAHMEEDLEEVKRHIIDEISQLTGHDVSQAQHIDIHRWRYANIGKQNGEPALLDTKHQLAACGDWCIQGRVESAFTSATALADELKAYWQAVPSKQSA